MTKLEVNNEIVAMRHAVRQAKVHVVRKLIKQVKLLRTKRGVDKKKDKYKRKADRLSQEILAAKELLDDEVSKFSITERRSLADILTDSTCDAKTCVLARLSNHKVVADKVSKFKEKFPYYDQHLGPGKRKLMKLRRKAEKEAIKAAKICNTLSDSSKFNDSVEMEQSDTHDGVSSCVEEGEQLLVTEKSAETQPPKKKVKMSNASRLETKKKVTDISLASKESTVKRFTELLEANVEGEAESVSACATELLEANVEEKAESVPVVEKTSESKIILEKEVDSFFMTANGDSEYLSVAVPKSDANDEEDDTRHPWERFTNAKSMKLRNNRSFDKLEPTNFERKGRFSEQIKRPNSYKEDDSRTLKRGRNDARAASQNSNEMHPSWAAKKKQQEILKQGFQGKKIVFDND